VTGNCKSAKFWRC